MSYYYSDPNDPDGDRSYRLALEEAEELSIDLEVWRSRYTFKEDKDRVWNAIASWPLEKEARRLWQLGDPDHEDDEPRPARELWGFGGTAGEAAWRALRKICDEG